MTYTVLSIIQKLHIRPSAFIFLDLLPKWWSIAKFIISFIVLIIVSFTIYLIYTNPAYFQKQKNTDNYSQPIIDSTSNLIPINIDFSLKINKTL